MKSINRPVSQKHQLIYLHHIFTSLSLFSNIVFSKILWLTKLIFHLLLRKSEQPSIPVIFQRSHVQSWCLDILWLSVTSLKFRCSVNRYLIQSLDYVQKRFCLQCSVVVSVNWDFVKIDLLWLLCSWIVSIRSPSHSQMEHWWQYCSMMRTIISWSYNVKSH